MDSQLSGRLHSDPLADHHEQIALPAQEQPRPKPQLEPDNSKSSSPSSDFAKEEVIGMVTRAHKDTFMYNQEPRESSAESSAPPRERLPRNLEQYSVSQEHGVGGPRGRFPCAESPPLLGGHYKGRSGGHYPGGHAVCVAGGHCVSFPGAYTQRVCDRVSVYGFSKNENKNGFLCNTGGRMHLV